MSSLAQTPGVSTGPHLDNRRIAAALIDLVVPLAMGACAYAAGLSMTKGLALVAVGWTLYYFFALESGDGQTLGKRVMKLRVVSADGSPATTEQIAKRTVVRILDGHIVGLIVMLASGERRQRLGDIVAGTVVTEAGPVVAPLTEAEPELPGDPPNEPARRTLRTPSLPGAAVGRRSLGRPAAQGSQSTVGLGAPEPTVEIPELDPVGPYEDREPFVELEGPEPLVELEREPVVELDEPLVGYEDREPVVELDDSLVGYEQHEPVVELDDSLVGYEQREPFVELEGPEPLVELEREPVVELDEVEPRPEPDRESPSEPAHDEELTVKPIETVSAIDLVMQDAEERRPTDR